MDWEMTYRTFFDAGDDSPPDPNEFAVNKTDSDGDSYAKQVPGGYLEIKSTDVADGVIVVDSEECTRGTKWKREVRFDTLVGPYNSNFLPMCLWNEAVPMPKPNTTWPAYSPAYVLVSSYTDGIGFGCHDTSGALKYFSGGTSDPDSWVGSWQSASKVNPEEDEYVAEMWSDGEYLYWLLWDLTKNDVLLGPARMLLSSILASDYWWMTMNEPLTNYHTWTMGIYEYTRYAEAQQQAVPLALGERRVLRLDTARRGLALDTDRRGLILDTGRRELRND